MVDTFETGSLALPDNLFPILNTLCPMCCLDRHLDTNIIANIVVDDSPTP